MSDLRAKLIEGMRQGTRERTGFEPFEHIAEAALDAFLDCLAEELDERDRWSDIVAALGRGDTREERE